MIKNLILASTLLLFSAGSFASGHDKPCKADKEKFCTECKKGQKKCFKNCMKVHESELSAECKAGREEKRREKTNKPKSEKKVD